MGAIALFQPPFFRKPPFLSLGKEIKDKILILANDNVNDIFPEVWIM